MNSARILVVDDEANIRELLQEILSEEGYDVTTAADANEARAARRQHSYDLTLLDIWMPDTDGISLLKEWSDSGTLDPVVMMSGHGTVDTAVEATRLGALDFIEKPVSLSKLLRTVSKALTSRRSREGRGQAIGRAATPVGKSEVIRNLRERVLQVARFDTPVLFSGESGSGRELYAHYLAANSVRSEGPFEVVAGSYLTEPDAESLLVGSVAEPGALERASGGHLFIDGIDHASQRAEQILLGAVQSRQISRPGTDPIVPLDFRMLMSAESGPRDDETPGARLMAAIGVVQIRVPPLREYSEDVPELLRYHVDRFVEEQNLPFRQFSIAAQNRLRNYPWPGNVAELRDVVKHLLVFGGDEEIDLPEVESQLAAESREAEPLIKQDLLAMPLREAREHFERAYLQQQLMLCGGKVGQLAKRVGMERTHLYRKLRALGVDFRQAAGDE
jgi:two-component system nitrogen regulation response regulator NtrX